MHSFELKNSWLFSILKEIGKNLQILKNFIAEVAGHKAQNFGILLIKML